MTQIVMRCMLEILGAPKEFIAEKLKEHVERVKSEGVQVQVEKYAEPVQQDKLFTQFVELQVAFKDVEELLDFCFDSMPSSVEILSPEKLTLDMAHFEQFLNDFQAKLHHTDMMLKGMQAQKAVLDKNAINVFHNFIKFACKAKPHTLEQLSALLGLGVKELTPFVNGLVEKKILKKEGEAFKTNE